MFTQHSYLLLGGPKDGEHTPIRGQDAPLHLLMPVRVWSELPQNRMELLAAVYAREQTSDGVGGMIWQYRYVETRALRSGESLT